MSFDWGGFTGSIAGTLGAFIIAVGTIKHQNKKELPSRFKMKYRIVLSFKQILLDAPSLLTVQVDPNDGFTKPVFDLLNKSISVRNSIEAFLPEAIEADQSLFKLIEQVAEDTATLYTDYFESYFDKLEPEMILDHNKVQEYCNQFLTVYRKKVQEDALVKCSEIITGIKIQAGIDV